jgi:D-lactate dehydrogenase
MEDATLALLISMPNVLVTSHQAFLTNDALENIARTTLQNVKDWKDGKDWSMRCGGLQGTGMPLKHPSK